MRSCVAARYQRARQLAAVERSRAGGRAAQKGGEGKDAQSRRSEFRKLSRLTRQRRRIFFVRRPPTTAGSEPAALTCARCVMGCGKRETIRLAPCFFFFDRRKKAVQKTRRQVSGGIARFGSAQRCVGREALHMRWYSADAAVSFGIREYLSACARRRARKVIRYKTCGTADNGIGVVEQRRQRDR